jgi:hypothetical protein
MGDEPTGVVHFFPEDREMTWHPVEKYIALPLLLAIVLALAAGVL